MSRWSELPPFKFQFFPKPIPINGHQFVLAPSYYMRSIDGIYTFNTNTNEWIKLLDYPDHDNFRSDSHSTSFDKKNQIIYLCNRSQLLRFNLKTKSVEIVSTNINFGSYPGLVYVNDHIHIIGGENTDQHLIFDEKKNNFNEIYSFNTVTNLLFGHSILYMKSRNSILLFGSKSQLTAPAISEFSMVNKKWNEWKMEIPDSVYYSATVSTKDEQYIFILGGYLSGGGWSNDIFVFDVKRDAFFKSSIKCPLRTQYRGVIMKNDYKDELLTFGFIHKLFIDGTMNDVQELPCYIIKLISEWVSNDYIHLIEFNSGKHWKISVDHILSSCNN
eukprot:495393_1